MSMSPFSRPQRRYGAEEQATILAVLAEHGGNIAATSATTGVPEQTIRNWRDQTTRVADPALVARLRVERAEKWEELADAGIARSLEMIGQASAKDAAIIGAIATEKAELCRGGSGPGSTTVTVNVNPPSLTLTASDIEAAKLLIAQVRTLPPAPDRRGSVVEIPPDTLPETPHRGA